VESCPCLGARIEVPREGCCKVEEAILGDPTPMGVVVRGVEWDLSPRPSLKGRGLLRLQIEGSGPR